MGYLFTFKITKSATRRFVNLPRSTKNTLLVTITVIKGSKPTLLFPDHGCKDQDWDSGGEIENSGKSIFEIRIPNLCYIQVIVFDFSYLPVAAVGTKAIAQAKNYNLNVTEVRDSGF